MPNAKNERSVTGRIADFLLQRLIAVNNTGYYGKKKTFLFGSFFRSRFLFYSISYQHMKTFLLWLLFQPSNLHAAPFFMKNHAPYIPMMLLKKEVFIFTANP